MLPLLLPDSPVAIWWPTSAPADTAADPLGALAQRRITDSAAVPRGKSTAMLTQCRDLRSRQHRPELDPADAVARAAGRGPGPAPPQGDRRQGDRRADQPQRRPAGGLARPTGSRSTVDPRQLRRPRHHRGQHGHQGGPDPHLPRRRPAGDVHLPQPARPAGRAQAPRGARPCSRRSCGASTRTTSTPPPRPDWSSSEEQEVTTTSEVRTSPRRRRRARRRRRLRAARPARGRAARGGVPQVGAHRAAPSPRSSTASSPAAPPDSGVDWSRVVFWWGDERFVARRVRGPQRGPGPRGLLDHVGVDPANVHEVPASDQVAPAEAAAGPTARRCASTAPGPSRC